MILKLKHKVFVVIGQDKVKLVINRYCGQTKKQACSTCVFTIMSYQQYYTATYMCITVLILKGN